MTEHTHTQMPIIGVQDTMRVIVVILLRFIELVYYKEHVATHMLHEASWGTHPTEISLRVLFILF